MVAGSHPAITGESTGFPLVTRAEQAGVLDGRSALIVAPTATGKSYIGREAILRALRRGPLGTQVYLVPYRALAEEIYHGFLAELAATDCRVRIATGDHRDAIRPGESDLLVATYESFDGLVRRNALRPDVVVADEFHLLADETRGPGVEGLVARLLALKRVQSLIALSAVIDNGAELATWLGISLLEGSPEDRPVHLSLDCPLVDDLDEGLDRCLEPCLEGRAQAIVFCSSRAGAEKTARRLGGLVAETLSATQRGLLEDFAAGLAGEDDLTTQDLKAILTVGVAYHHAGLSRDLRQRVETAFRQRQLRVIAATPTLAAGVNLPADITVVRDVFRAEPVRGRFRHVLLPSGEVLNMLGRAARPKQVESGRGVALVERRRGDDDEVKTLIDAVRQGRGGRVRSRLPDSFEALMRFVLAAIVERGETTRSDIASVFERTFAYHSDPGPITFDRDIRDDLMEDIPAYRKVIEAAGGIRLASYEVSPSGVRAVVASGDKSYEVTISVTGLTCTCPAASKYYRNEICKHQACAVHDLLFGDGADPEARARTLYNCGHVFGATLDLGSRLTIALDILTEWRLLERVPGGWCATPMGEIGSTSGFDMLLVRQAVERVSGTAEADWRAAASWAAVDYFEDLREEAAWLRALEAWLSEADERRFRLPTRYRGDFENRLEDLARVCLLYEQAARALGKEDLASSARDAAGAVRYGVAPELVPLMALGFPQLGRARCRLLYERGIDNVKALAAADPAYLADPRRLPERFLREWVERAREIVKAHTVAGAGLEEDDAEIDELVARFRLDPAALTRGRRKAS